MRQSALRQASQFIDQIASSSDSELINSKYIEFVDSIGFENYNIADLKFLPSNVKVNVWATNALQNHALKIEKFPDWHKPYAAAVDWREITTWRTDQKFERKDIQQLFDFFDSVGERMCLTVPMLKTHDYLEAVKLTSRKFKTIDDEDIDAARSVSQVFRLKLMTLQTFASPALDDTHQADINLSDRQLEIVKWIRDGKSNNDIATIMNLPLRTVKHHVSEIIRRLGVATRAQAASITTVKRQD